MFRANETAGPKVVSACRYTVFPTIAKVGLMVEASIAGQQHGYKPFGE
jgi:hypothetical protein